MSDIEEPNSWQEEADSKIVAHTKWSIKMGSKRIIVLCNNTDSVITLLRYIAEFVRDGLMELWVQFATEEKRQMIHIHVLHQVLGEELCRVLIQVHVTTDNDSLNMIVTELAGLRSKPLHYLSSFWRITCKL